MNRVLVTGASGFTGGHLCRRLIRDGHKVAAFVRATSDTAELEKAGVECRVVDICDPISVAAEFDSVDTVFHLAAAFRSEHPDRSYFRRVNAGATATLLRIARERGVERFVHCLTVGVQGRVENPPATEEYRVAPRDAYQVSKLEGELLAREAGRAGLPVCVVRPAGIYGPGDRRFLKLFKSIAGRRFVMFGSGEVLYHLTYIDDLVDGMLLAATQADAVGEVFTIAGPRFVTLNELVRLVADVLGAPAPRFRLPYAPLYRASDLYSRAAGLFGLTPRLYPRRVEFFELDRAFDITKARRKLGYEPKVGLKDGLARTARWYRAAGLLQG